MKKSLFILWSIIVLTACSSSREDIVILFDNDVHCAVEGYAQMESLRAQIEDSVPYVAVVSCGDFAQGDKAGSLSKGEYIVDVMNTVPYDVVTLGNHEFDYGMKQLKRLTSRLNAKTVCCNFGDIRTGKQPYKPYIIRRYGPVKVAYIGVATPTTLTTSTPTNFMDKDGQCVYTFFRDSTIALVQQAADKAREQGADYVVVLSHLGDDTEGVNSVDLIHHTHGIDVVLDGHQHHVLNQRLADAAGDSVILASTGCYFRYIGQLTIGKEGTKQVALIPVSKPYRGEYTRTCRCIDKVQRKLECITARAVGFAQVELTMNDANGERLVRSGETNLGDFTADAMRKVAGAQIGVVNGGGLRASLPAGNVNYGQLVGVCPFNNTLYTVEATGQQMIDALEVAVRLYPEESGDFMQVSGLRYTFDASVPSSVCLDERGLYIPDSLYAPSARRRVVSVEVQEEDGSWTAIEPQKTYTVAGLSYILVCEGAAGMYRFTKPLPGEHIADTEVLARYIAMIGDTIQACDYAEAAGRITIVP